MTKKSLKRGAVTNFASQKKFLPKKGLQPKKEVNKKGLFNLSGLTFIILLGIVIYSDSFRCSFHLDDLLHIVYNRVIQNLWDVKAWWNYIPNRPVSIFTFVLNYHFFKLDVWYWHLVNLIIHLINAILIWWLTLLIFSSPALKDQPIFKHKKALAFVTALLFVSHPLAIQSVTYIVQRMTSLVTMFYILSLALYMKVRLSDNRTFVKYLFFAGSVISAILAMLTKENAFTLPMAIVLVELYFLRTNRRMINFRDYRVVVLTAIFLVVMLIVPFKYSFSVFNPIPPRAGHINMITPVNYLFTQFSVILKYIELLFLPVNLHLEYDFPVAKNFFELRTLLSFLVLSSLVVLAIFLFKKHRIISFGICWFFLTLSIESGIIPIQDVIFEHRTYLPSFGFFLILVTGLYVLLWKKYKFMVIAVLTIITGLNSCMTYQRNKVWKNDLTLLSDNIAKAPGFARPFCNRGVAYWKNRDYNLALADFSRAIEINPDYRDAYYNRGVVFDNIRQFPQAIADYSRAIVIDQNHLKAYYNRGVVYWNLREYDKAIADYSRAIEINPDYANAFNNRGVVFEYLKEYDKAIADFTRAIGINPNYKDAYSNRGATFWTLKEWKKAIADYSRAIEIDPNYKEAYVNRAIAFGNLEQWDRAIADYDSALKIAPDYAMAYTNREIAYRNFKR